MTERFDREGRRRVPYISGLSAVEGRDGDHSLTYLDLAEFVEAEGADPARSLLSLWCHALVSAAIGNVDNHMRNFGFLRAGKGWALSPVFDVNPTRPEQRGPFATSLDGSGGLSVREVLDSRDLFRVGEAEASKACVRLLRALRGWRAAARRAGISPASIESYEGCFSQAAAAVAEQMHEKRGRANEPIDRQLAARGPSKGRPGEKPIEEGERGPAKRPAPADEQEVDDG